MLFPKSKKEWEASRAREREGKEEGREGGSLWWQVLSAQTLNKRGLSWACAIEQRAQGTCVTHIPERKTGPAAYYPHHVVIKSQPGFAVSPRSSPQS